jgi:hypothetical protein
MTQVAPWITLLQYGQFDQSTAAGSNRLARDAYVMGGPKTTRKNFVNRWFTVSSRAGQDRKRGSAASRATAPIASGLQGGEALSWNDFIMDLLMAFLAHTAYTEEGAHN